MYFKLIRTDCKIGSLSFNPSKPFVITVQDINLILLCFHGTVKGNSLCTIQVTDLSGGAEINSFSG